MILTGGFLTKVLFIIEITFLELKIFLNNPLTKDDFLGINSLKSFNVKGKKINLKKGSYGLYLQILSMHIYKYNKS